MFSWQLIKDNWYINRNFSTYKLLLGRLYTFRQWKVFERYDKRLIKLNRLIFLRGRKLYHKF